MDNTVATQWAARWREDPRGILWDLRDEGALLESASPGKVRLLWTVLEDLPDTDHFLERAEAFLNCLAGPNTGPERAEIVASLVAGHPKDLEGNINNALRGWQLGLAWAKRRWGQAGILHAAQAIPALFRPEPSYQQVLSHVLADVAREYPNSIDDATWVWAWLNVANEWGSQAKPTLEVLARAGIDLDSPNAEGWTPLQVLSKTLDDLEQKQQHKPRRGWMEKQKTAHVREAIDCLVECGAAWQRLDAPGDMLARRHLEHHPRVRADRLRALLQTQVEDRERERLL